MASVLMLCIRPFSEGRSGVVVLKPQFSDGGHLAMLVPPTFSLTPFKVARATFAVGRGRVEMGLVIESVRQHIAAALPTPAQP